MDDGINEHGVGRPRKWESDAERMHARRQAERDREEMEARRRAYVDGAVEAARVDAEDRVGKRLLGLDRDETLEAVDVPGRVARARAYAEWRWNGVQAGEIASL